jgi:hypothetical protein
MMDLGLSEEMVEIKGKILDFVENKVLAIAGRTRLARTKF